MLPTIWLFFFHAKSLPAGRLFALINNNVCHLPSDQPYACWDLSRRGPIGYRCRRAMLLCPGPPHTAEGLDVLGVPECIPGRIIPVCQDNLASILTYREAFSQQPLIQQLCLEPFFPTAYSAAILRLFAAFSAVNAECSLRINPQAGLRLRPEHGWSRILLILISRNQRASGPTALLGQAARKKP